MLNLTGRTLRGYDVLEKIGQGGLGIVYRARRLADGEDVVIKTIRPDRLQDSEAVRRFELEAELVEDLKHAHIVPMFDHWQDENGGYLVMRWLPGGNLRERFRRAPLSLADAARLMREICGALDSAHRVEVVHRDIKPDNILYDLDGAAYLTDFGVAKRLNAYSPITGKDGLVGSIGYSAPEQILNEKITPQTDVYALGITLFEALTGQHPFDDVTGELQVMMKQLRDVLPDVTVIRPELPPELNAILQKATAKAPEARYASAPDFEEAFRLVCGL